jgi:rhomboid family GlyGly-CTERM serine protease
MHSWRNARFSTWLLPGITLAVAAGLALLGSWGREALRYDRMAIADGEVWRLVSGHFVHLGWSHFVLNGVGFGLICYLVAARFGVRQWLLISGIVIAGIDLGFWFLQPQLVWYVGMSGLLHGLLAAGTVSGISDRQREFWLIAVFLVGKLGYEQLVGPLPGSEGTTGGSVVVAAHLYGAVSGGFAALCLRFRKFPAAPI